MSRHVFEDPAILKGYFEDLAQGPLSSKVIHDAGKKIPKPCKCKGNNYLFGTAIMSAAAIDSGLESEDCKTSKNLSVQRDSVVMKTTQAKICKDLELKKLFERSTQTTLPENAGTKALARVSQTYAAAVHRDCRNDPARFTEWSDSIFRKYKKITD
ncbi:hypothetical protein ABW21_db0203383 [Orbilia brochopaga]|nr:hypothetical protein ABW21_db0203383 [Drechslerella brochopaga]